MSERNALAELAERLKCHDCHDDDFYPAVEKAQRIIAELARGEKPICLPRGHGKTFTHLAEIIEAGRSMAVEIVRNCRIIAREGADYILRINDADSKNPNVLELTKSQLDERIRRHEVALADFSDRIEAAHKREIEHRAAADAPAPVPPHDCRISYRYGVDSSGRPVTIEMRHRVTNG